MSNQFSTFGLILVAIVLWLVSQSNDSDIRTIVNRFLGVLLLSMFLLNFNKIRPVFFKDATTTTTK